MKNYLIEHASEDQRLNFQNTIDVYNLDQELSFFPIEKRRNVLDAGCGNGNVTEKLLSKGVGQIDCLDLSETRVRQTKERFASNKNIRVFQGPLERTEFPDSSYEMIIARYIFEHVLNPKDILTELFRVLAPGGVFCIINFDDLFFNFHTKNQKLNNQIKELRSRIPQDFQIARKLPQLLKEVGFARVEWEAESYFFKGERLEKERENSRMRLEQGREHLSKFFSSLEEYDAFTKSYLEEMKDECNVLSMSKYLIKAHKNENKILNYQKRK